MIVFIELVLIWEPQGPTWRCVKAGKTRRVATRVTDPDRRPHWLRSTAHRGETDAVFKVLRKGNLSAAADPLVTSVTPQVGGLFTPADKKCTNSKSRLSRIGNNPSHSRVTLVKKGIQTPNMTCLATIDPQTLPCRAQRFDTKSSLVGVRVAGRGSVDAELTETARLRQDMIALLPRLRRFARTLARSAAEADDLVQDVCLKALDKADQWDPAQPLDRWMFRIARNHWISELRKQKVRLGEGQIPAEEASELRHNETGETSVLVASLGAQIASLPQDLSSVLLVVTVEGYSYAEAAALFDIPTGTVMSRIHRARKLLAERLDNQEQQVS